MKTNHGNGNRKEKLNWEEIHRQLQENTLAIEGDQVDLAVVQAIWDRRAAALSHKPDEVEQGDWIELALARIGRELYGLDARLISSIRPAQGITPVPRVPEWFAGVVNVRGRIYSVIHLQRFLMLPIEPAPESRGAPVMVVVETAETETVLLVDDLLVVEKFLSNRFRSSTGIIHGIPPEFVQGVVERQSGSTITPVTILNVPVLLSDRRLMVFEELIS